MAKYRIEKVMNNNIILAVDLQSNLEMVLLGKGIGFGKKEKSLVELDPSQIEKSFHTFDKKIKEEYFSLLSQIDEKVIGAIEEIISVAEQSLGKLNDHLHIVLTDHIEFALERIRMGIEIDNPFLHEIKALYPQEFEIGKRGAEIIKSRIGIEISEAEMGFIALYLNSARQNKTIKETVQDTRILRESIEIIEKELDYNINHDDVTYIRLINHLRVKLNYIQDGKFSKNPLLDTIKKQMPVAFKIARKIATHIEESKNLKVSEDEIGYMAIHIERIIREQVKKDLF